MRAAIWAANLLGWPVIHIAIASTVLRLPLNMFSSERTLDTGSEREAAFYRKWFLIQRWKSKLPDGAPWLKGFSKKRLVHKDREYLFTFLLETRRAELAHWCMLLCLPIFFLWNPPWACAVMAVYAVAANVPCIVAQRYNRTALSRILRKMDASQA